MEETRQIIEHATITECLLCKQTHESIKLRRYNERGTASPHPFFSHYYLCPVSGDPVGLTIKTDPLIALDQDVIGNLVEAQQSGRWMVAIWPVGRRAYFKTSKFPTDLFGESLRELRRWVRSLSSGPEVQKLEEAELKDDEPLFPQLDGQ